MTRQFDNSFEEVPPPSDFKSKVKKYFKDHFTKLSYATVARWIALTVAVFLIVVGVLIGSDVVWAREWIESLNSTAWVLANVLVLYIGVVLIIFVTSYYFLFDPRATTAGLFVFRFALSLGGVIGLVFISLFVDPSMGREWYVYPGDILIWRPIARLIAYFYVAYTISGLAVLLYLRRYHPEKLRTSVDRELVKPRKSV